MRLRRLGFGALASRFTICLNTTRSSALPLAAITLIRSCRHYVCCHAPLSAGLPLIRFTRHAYAIYVTLYAIRRHRPPAIATPWLRPSPEPAAHGFTGCLVCCQQVGGGGIDTIRYDVDADGTLARLTELARGRTVIDARYALLFSSFAVSAMLRYEKMVAPLLPTIERAQRILL